MRDRRSRVGVPPPGRHRATFRRCDRAEMSRSRSADTAAGEEMRAARGVERGGHIAAGHSTAATWGSSVNNLEGERIGVITEVVIDRERRKVVFVIIRVDDGFAPTLGIRIAVRWSLLHLNLDTADRSAPYLLDVTRRQLRLGARLDPVTLSDICAREIGSPSRIELPCLLRLPLR